MMTLDFDLLFHNPNPAIDAYLHGDHTHTDEDGNEVVSPGTPDRPVVIEPEPEPDPEPDPAPEPGDDPMALTFANDGDVLRGGDNDDTLTGSLIMIGGPGDDTLSRGDRQAEVIMIGGPGRDVFDVTGFGHDGSVRIVDFQDGVDKIKYGINGPHYRTYNLAVEAGLQWDMNWMFNELENGVNIATGGSDQWGELTILNIEPENLQFEIVGDEVFLI